MEGEIEKKDNQLVYHIERIQSKSKYYIFELELNKSVWEGVINKYHPHSIIHPNVLLGAPNYRL